MAGKDIEMVDLNLLEHESNRNDENESRDLPINEFITTNFKKRTCTKFIPKNSSSSICGCGHEHKKATKSPTVETAEKWEIQKHTETSATDAFGDVKFANSGKQIAKYIRVDYDYNETKMADLEKLMFGYWKMETPRLLISVTGGAQGSTIKPRLMEAFSQGLVKAATSTSAWIITGGTNADVAKYVGEALRDYKIKNGKKKPLVALGIAMWGCIENRDHLIRDEKDHSKESDGLCPAKYRVAYSQDKHEESSLDPNHTHFILVDNGTQKQSGDEIKFRAQLEIEVSKKASLKEPDSFPVVVCVVLGGDRDTLKTVKEAVKNETPVVIVKDSGTAADVLAFAYEKFQPEEQKETDSRQGAKTNDMWNEEVTSQLKMKFGDGLGESNINTYVGYIQDCVEKIHLLSIFHLKRGSSAIDFTRPILNAALLKVNRRIDQLRLAMDFDAIDVAKEKIFTDGVNIEELLLDDHMISAILKNRVAFVKLYLEKEVDLPMFFRNEEILRQELCQIPWVKARAETMPKEITIESLLRDFGVRSDVLRSVKIDDKIDYVFLWSVVAMHRELAMVILSERKEGTLAFVVAAHSISRTLLRKVPDPGFNQELSEQVTFYGEIALGLLSKYYLTDQRKSMQLIAAQGSFENILKIVQSDNMNSPAHSACQEFITKVWNGKLSDDNSLFRLLTAIFCPFVAPLLLKFRDKTTCQSQSAADNSSETSVKDSSQTPKISCATYFKRLSYFFQAPEIKFSYNFLSHLAFLLLYGIILLTDFYPKIGITEIILIAWVATLIAEEISQIIINAEHDIRKGLYNYIKDIWNIMDVITIVAFLAGMILRFIPVSTCGQCFYAARIILALNFMTFCFRILYVFSIHRELGPKLVMIGKMVIDLFYFMIILFVFIAAYGIASHAILYPNQPLNMVLARDVLSRSWWNIFGELGIDEISGEACHYRTVQPYAEQCASMDEEEFSSYGCSNYKEDKCPSITWLIPIMLAIYVLIANVLMLNLLIAMFSNTFSKIHEQTEVVWQMQRYRLVREYESLPMLPPPLIILAHVYLLIRYAYKRCSKDCPNLTRACGVSDSTDPSASSLTSEMSRWEKMYAQEYFQKRDLHYTAADKEHDSNDKLDLILSTQKEISKRLAQLEKQASPLKA